MKKKILIGSFLLLVLVTAIIFGAAAIDSYNYDMDPANRVDILQGFEAVILMIIGQLIMIPMITSKQEVSEARKILQEVKDELKAENKEFCEDIKITVFVILESWRLKCWILKFLLLTMMKI